ncbi:MAG: cyclodeaminase/cyclohydrolase family protein [Deltaproteobacteria bacterium]|jgi:formiminotetrahydrofolate cyclodeaminase|nr:cyclodeaminase/cyclohydrolase family protein [Deltaproteobacteria bacterium]
MNPYLNFYEKPFNEILDLAASKRHVPGGGSVAAMSAALGATMGSMVANLTLHKQNYEAVQDEIRGLLNTMTDGLNEIKALTALDMDSFDLLLSAYRLPRETNAQSIRRQEEIQKYTVQASNVPLRISSLANDLLVTNKRIAEIGNGSAVNDCAVAAILLESAARAAILSVDVNLPNIKDKEVKEDITSVRNRILTEARVSCEETVRIVSNRDKKL